jgi:hypothetical protein
MLYFHSLWGRKEDSDYTQQGVKGYRAVETNRVR